MSTDFDAWIAFAWRPDFDGQGDHVDAHDPGGETNHGITIGTWNDAVAHGLVEGALHDATIEQLGLILRVRVWRPLSCDRLATGVNMVVADMGMLAGVGRAARLLQQMVGAGIDGDVGSLTCRAAAHVDPVRLVRLLTQRDETFLAGLRNFKWFGRGWDRRAEACRDAALARIEATEAA